MIGNIDASEYKSVVLGLIFLKYISDRFEVKYQELVEEGEVLRKIKTNILAVSMLHHLNVGEQVHNFAQSSFIQLWSGKILKKILFSNFDGLSQKFYTLVYR